MKKIIIASLFAFISCKEESAKKETVSTQKPVDTLSMISVQDTTTIAAKLKSIDSLKALPDTTFVRLADYSDAFAFDMRYATDNNFLKAKVYDCAECYVRAKTAVALINANKKFLEKGYRIKFFDCYRPLDVQKKMWKIVPNPIYVADPARGSIHNKGGAVDITLVDKNTGEEMPMGTGFDYFGQEAHHTYKKLPDEVIANRTLLKNIMEDLGFWSIESEWWHYNLSAMSNAKVANFVWDCPTE